MIKRLMCVLTALTSCLFLFSACGERPGIVPLLDGSAGEVDAATPPPDAAVPDPDGEVLPETCEWVAGDVHRLTDPPSDKGLHTVAVTDQGVLVAWQVTNPDPPNDNTRRLQRITYLGELDRDPEPLFPPPGPMTGYGGIRLAVGPDHFGATVWDEPNGCRFRPIDAAGNVLGSPRRVADTNCGSLRSTPQGFTLFTRDYAAQQRRLIRLNPDGVVVHQSQSIPALEGDVFWWSSARLSGGDMLVAAMHGGLEPSEIRIQRLDSDGEPQTDPTAIVQLSVSSSRVRLILTGDGLLAGWFETEGGGPSHQHQRIVLVPLNTVGQIVGPTVRLTNRYAYRDAGWSLTRFGDQILSAFVEPLDSDSYGDHSAVVVQPFTFQGQPDGPAVELHRERFARDTLIRRTPRGVIVVYSAYPGELPHQLYAGAVLCEHPVR